MTARWDRIAGSLDVNGLAISLGLSGVLGAVSKFGAHFNLDTGELPTSLTTAVLADGGIYPYPSAAGALEIISTLATDSAAGAGMRTVTIHGLDADWNLQILTVTLNGITAVPIPGTWIRVFRMYGETVGTYGGANLGEIVVRPSGGGSTLLHIPVGYGQTVHALWTVPENTRAHFKTWSVVNLPKAAAEAVSAHVAIFTRENDQADRPFRMRQAGSLNVQYDQIVPSVLEPKTDVEMRVITVDANNTQLAGTFQMVLERLEEEA